MNLPNQLTVARLFLTVGFVAAVESGLPYGNTIGLVIFTIASITDYLDGYLARKHNLVTNFGKLMDPLADKILTAAAFILLVSVPEGKLPAWIVVLIVSREFLITGLRLLALDQGYVLSADRLGKHKTAWQMITIFYYLGLMAWTDWNGADSVNPDWPWNIGLFLAVIAAALTAYSGAAYLIRNWQVLREQPSGKK